MKSLRINVYELAEHGYHSEDWREIMGTNFTKGYMGDVPIHSVRYVQASLENLFAQDLVKKAFRIYFMKAPEDCIRPVDGWRLISIERREAKKKTEIDLYCQSDRFGWRKIHCELSESKSK